MADKGKSTILTYILWLIGGIFGLHHFYLGRDLQGFLWWCTLGGYFGCGWIRDIFHIKEYVANANEDKEYIKKLKDTVKKNKKPPFSSTRFIGMIVVAYLWTTVYSLGIPEEEIGGFSFQWLHVLNPLVCALGIWCVGNVGHEQGSIWLPLFAAYASFPLKYVTDESSAFTLTVLITAFVFDTFSKQWRPRPKREKNCFKRFVVIGVCCMLYASLWSSYFFFNAKITDADNEEIPLREALYHFLKSPWWLDVKQSFVDVWEFAQQHGWLETWRQIVVLSDPNGEQNAFKVLELSSGVSQSEINTRCRTLAVKFHPDRFKTEPEKLSAQEHFYEIQQACELLSNNRAKRRRKNKKFSEE